MCVHTRVEAYLADEEPAVTERKNDSGEFAPVVLQVAVRWCGTKGRVGQTVALED